MTAAGKEVVAFGLHAVRHALSHGGMEGVLLLQTGRKDRRMLDISRLAEVHGIPTRMVARAELDKQVAGRHQGVVLLGQARQASRPALMPMLEALEEAAFLLVLDGVQDPHNLGACLRSADAAGVHAVIAPRDRAAALGATVRKVAAGAAEHVPFYQVTNLARTLRSLRTLGIRVVGTAGESETRLFETDLTGPLALVMGGEEKGLRRLTREHCDLLVSLPMTGSVESLNVSVTAGICLFEVVRQRLG